MRDEAFQELVKSIEEMKAIEAGEIKPARVTRPPPHPGELLREAELNEARALLFNQWDRDISAARTRADLEALVRRARGLDDESLREDIGEMIAMYAAEIGVLDELDEALVRE